MPQVFLLSLLAAVVPIGTLPWRDTGTADGIRVEERVVADSPYRELRVSTRSRVDLKSLCDAVFGKGLSSKPEGQFKKREILWESDSERWTYEQIGVPIVKDRDYVMHVKLEHPASEGRCEIAFQTENIRERPPVRGFVRIPTIRGRWSLEQGDGGVDVSYVVYSDPGGELPPFLVRSGQRNAAVDFMKTILKRAGGPPPVSR